MCYLSYYFLFEDSYHKIFGQVVFEPRQVNVQSTRPTGQVGSEVNVEAWGLYLIIYIFIRFIKYFERNVGFYNYN